MALRQSIPLVTPMLLAKTPGHLFIDTVSHGGGLRVDLDGDVRVYPMVTQQGCLEQGAACGFHADSNADFFPPL